MEKFGEVDVQYYFEQITSKFVEAEESNCHFQMEDRVVEASELKVHGVRCWGET